MRKSTVKYTMLMCCVLLAAAASAQTTYNVFAGASDSGTDWTTIAGAVTAASSGDTVDLADSATYAEEVMLGTAFGNPKDLTFTNTGGATWAPPNVGAFGAGMGAGIVVGAGVTSLTLDGITMDGSVNTAAYGVASFAPIMLTVDNSTLNGFALNAIAGSDGFGPSGLNMGGMDFNNSAFSVSMTNTSITSCVNAGIWADVHNAGTSGYFVLNMDNSSVDNNNTAGTGAAIHVISSDGPNGFTLTNGSTVNGNGWRGLEVLSNTTGSTSITINNATFSGNVNNHIAVHDGPGANVYGFTGLTILGGNNGIVANGPGSFSITLDNCSVTGGNNAINLGAEGGVDLDVLDTTGACTLSGARAIWWHPAATTGTNTIDVTNAVMAGNTAEAVLTQLVPVDVTLTGCDLTASGGWGMNHSAGGTATMTTCTISNTGAPSQNGIYVAAGSFSGTGLTIDNVIGNAVEAAGVGVTFSLASSTVNAAGNNAIGVAGVGTVVSLTNTTIQNSFQGLWNTGQNLDVTLDNTQITGCTSAGWSNLFQTNNGADNGNTITLLNGSSISNNAGWNEVVADSLDEVFTLNMTDSHMDNNAYNLRAEPNFPINIDLSMVRSTMDGAATHGIEFQCGTLNWTAVDSSVSNTGAGSALFVDNPTPDNGVTPEINCDFTNCSFDNNVNQMGFWIQQANNGFNLTATGCSWNNNIRGFITGSSGATPVVASLTDCEIITSWDGAWTFWPGGTTTIDLTMNGCTISDHGRLQDALGTPDILSDDYWGEAISINGGTVENMTFTDCTFEGNHGWTFANHGAAPGAATSISFTGCDFIGGTELSVRGTETVGVGAPIHCPLPLDLNFVNCHFEDWLFGPFQDMGSDAGRLVNAAAGVSVLLDGCTFTNVRGVDPSFSEVASSILDVISDTDYTVRNSVIGATSADLLPNTRITVRNGSLTFDNVQWGSAANSLWLRIAYHISDGDIDFSATDSTIYGGLWANSHDGAAGEIYMDFDRCRLYNTHIENLPWPTQTEVSGVHITALNTLFEGDGVNGSVFNLLQTLRAGMTNTLDLTHCTVFGDTTNILAFINEDTTATTNYSIWDGSLTANGAANQAVIASSDAAAAISGAYNVMFDGGAPATDGVLVTNNLTNTIVADPLLSAEGRLTDPASPALSAAIGSTLTVDFEGDVRPYSPNGEPDIGADEEGFAANDDVPPVVSSNVINDTVTVASGNTFASPVTAWDAFDGDVTASLTYYSDSGLTTSVDPAVYVDTNVATDPAAPEYTLYVTAQDNQGNVSETLVLYVEIMLDTDNDLLDDNWEILYWGDITTVNEPYGDYDGDGVTNLQEYIDGTDPTDPASRLPVAAGWALMALAGAISAAAVLRSARRS